MSSSREELTSSAPTVMASRALGALARLGCPEVTAEPQLAEKAPLFSPQRCLSAAMLE